MPKAIRSSTILVLCCVGAFFLGGCAELRVDYQTPLFMESGDTARERVSTWIGPWVRFSVTDLRPAEGLKYKRAGGAETFPQESVYFEERDYAYGLGEAIEMMLGEREGPSDFAPKSADLCLRRYDFIRRPLDENVIQYEVHVQYGFRAITTEPCQGEHEFFYATWSAGYAGGSVEERAKSEALGSFIDQVLREYFKLSRDESLQLQAINLAVVGVNEEWTPAEYESQWIFDTTPIQSYQSVHSAIGRMLAQQLVPEINITALSLDAPPAQPLMPTLVIEPIYLGIVPEPTYLAVVGLGEWVAVSHVRVRLVWPNGAVLFDRKIDGGCVPSPVLRCTSYRQIETIARDLRKEIPYMLSYARRQPPGAPQAGEAAPAEESSSPNQP